MKYWYLDSLRWIAILLVLFSHIHFTGVSVPAWRQNWAIWVSLFFLVSAYTICLSQEKSNQDWNTFFQKRFFRIYPLFFLIITAVYILYFFRSIFSSVWENINPHLNYFLHLGFLYGFFPSWINSFHLWEWSLFSESWFYLLFPIFWKVCKNSIKNTIFLVIFLALISTLWHFYMDPNPIGKNIPERWLFVYYFPLRHIVSFWLGILLFHIHKLIDNKNFSNKNKTKDSNKVNFFSLKNILENKQNLKKILFLITFFWTFYLVFLWIDWKSISFFHTNIYFFFLILAFMLGSYKLIDKNFLQYVWKISYSLYLLNLPIIFIAWNIIARYNLDKTLVSIFAILVLFLIANQTYKFELAWINLRKNLPFKKNQSKAAIDNFGL